MAKQEVLFRPEHIQVFKFVKKFTDKNIFAPEAEEIAKGTKLSVRQVWRAVDQLVEWGYLSKIPYTPRSIKILKELK